jgi:predicted transcriptional regulator
MTINYFEAKQILTDNILRTMRENPCMSYDEIAAKFGVPRYLVSYRAKAAGIVRPKGRISGRSPQKAVR